jgi:hypothetical protein
MRRLASLGALALLCLTTDPLVAGSTVPIFAAVAGSWRSLEEHVARPAGSGAAPPGGQAVYLEDGRSSGRFVRIHPETLADMPDESGFDSAPPGTTPADGSIVLTSEWASHSTAVVVRDLRTGAEVASHRLPGDLCCLALSRDGYRIFAAERERGGTTRLRLFDALSGQPIAALPTGGDQGPWDSYWLSPDGARVTVYHQPAADDGPRTPRVTVYDLLGGVEVGRVAADGVLAGQWLTKRTVDGEPTLLWAHWLPGVALSPDGQRLFIVHADRDHLTVVDTQRVAIERTVPLTRPNHVLDHLLDPVRVRVASAKGPSAGVTRQARFSPDGRQLYVITTEHSPTPTRHGVATRRTDTLGVVDAATGRRLAQAPEGHWVSWIKPSVDGRSLYVLSTEQRSAHVDAPAPGRWLLRRLDGRTLAVLGERDLDDFRSLVILPQPQPGR